MTAIAETTAPVSRSRVKADLALVFVAFVWGTTFVVVKGALSDLSTVYFLALRFTLAAVCMIPMLVPLLRNNRTQVWAGLRAGAVVGLLLWLGFLLQTLGLNFTTASNSGFLTGIYVVLVPVISAAFYRRWPNRSELLGITAAAIGIVLLTFPSLDRDFRPNRGDVLTLGCAVVFAFHLLALGYYSQRVRYEALAAGQIACAALLSIITLPLDPPRGTWSKQAVIAILLTGVLATAIAFAIQTWAQQHTSATRTALIFALEPVFAMLTAMIVGGEQITWRAAAGGVLILAGILSVEMKPGV
jgi:drug/metabolite transporter (DMT)-like permease